MSFKTDFLDKDSTSDHSPSPCLLNLSIFLSHFCFHPRFHPPCLVLSVARLFPPKHHRRGDSNRQANFIFSIPSAYERKTLRSEGKEKRRDQGPLNTGETAGVHAIFPPSPRLISAGGNWLHKQASRSHPLYSFYHLSTKPFIIWIIHAPQKLPPKSLNCMWQAMCTLYSKTCDLVL